MPDVAIAISGTDTSVNVSVVEAAVNVSVVEAAVNVTGVPGPQGASGNVLASLFVAGENISGHSVIKVIGGLAYKCTAATFSDTGKAIGIATGAVLSGASVSVQQGGQLTEPSWSWTEGPVYVGPTGFLTQDPSGLAYAHQIGVAVSATTVDINPQMAVVLA